MFQEVSTGTRPCLISWNTRISRTNVWNFLERFEMVQGCPTYSIAFAGQCIALIAGNYRFCHFPVLLVPVYLLSAFCVVTSSTVREVIFLGASPVLHPWCWLAANAYTHPDASSAEPGSCGILWMFASCLDKANKLHSFRSAQNILARPAAFISRIFHWCVFAMPVVFSSSLHASKKMFNSDQQGGRERGSASNLYFNESTETCQPCPYLCEL